MVESQHLRLQKILEKKKQWPKITIFFCWQFCGSGAWGRPSWATLIWWYRLGCGDVMFPLKMPLHSTCHLLGAPWPSSERSTPGLGRPIAQRSLGGHKLLPQAALPNGGRWRCLGCIPLGQVLPGFEGQENEPPSLMGEWQGDSEEKYVAWGTLSRHLWKVQSTHSVCFMH